MKVPLSWLKKIINTTLPAEEIAHALTMAGLEVEAIEEVQLPFENIVVCSVAEIEKHPHADNLKLATIFNGKEKIRVVCGAPNCRVGLKTAFAGLDSSLKDDKGKAFKIKKRKVREIESCGMLCSEEELQLSDDGDGIIEFDDDLQDGLDVKEIFQDTIFEISLTPNLGHCASIIGIARELSAILNIPIKEPALPSHKSTTIKNLVEIKDKDLCLRYSCQMIKNVKVGPSPTWLKQYLKNAGMRSVNHIVDITNFVMLERGQPLHAFDYDKLAGGKIIVKKANKNTNFKTLDKIDHSLSSDMLLICDEKKPVALAGIMGGCDAEVSNDTTIILLESAHFEPLNIRKTSKQLKIMTESSKRFERGCDPNNTIPSLMEAAQLIEELAQGEIASEITDIKEQEFKEKKLSVRLKRINDVLGLSLGSHEVEALLKRLQLKIEKFSNGQFSIKAPTYRNDLNEEIDLVEEVARIYGYNNIKPSNPKYHESPMLSLPFFNFETTIRNILIGNGLQEMITCNLISPKQAKIAQKSGSIKVLNPISEEQSVMRNSLLPGLLQVIRHNHYHQNHNVSAFEIGHIHFKSNENYQEQLVAAIILTGKNRPYHWDKPSDVNFFDLKGVLENLFNQLKLTNFSFVKTNIENLHPGRQAKIIVNSIEMGIIGEVHPTVLKEFDISSPIVFAEIELNELFHTMQEDHVFLPLPQFPSSTRDWTFYASDKLPIGDILTFIRSIKSRLLEQVSILDVYESDKFEKGQKSVTLHFVYRDNAKTITQKALEKEHSRIMENVKIQFKEAIT